MELQSTMEESQEINEEGFASHVRFSRNFQFFFLASESTAYIRMRNSDSL